MFARSAIIAICFIPFNIPIPIFGAWLICQIKASSRLETFGYSLPTLRAEIKATTKSAVFALLLFGLVRLTTFILIILSASGSPTDTPLSTATAVLESLGATFLIKVFIGYALFNETEVALERKDSHFEQGKIQIGLNFLVLLAIILFIIGATNFPVSWAASILKVGGILNLVLTMASGMAFCYMTCRKNADFWYFPVWLLLLVRIVYSTASLFQYSISVLFGHAGWGWLAFAIFLPELLFVLIVCAIQYRIVLSHRSNLSRASITLIESATAIIHEHA